MPQGIDEQNRENAVKTIAGKQRRNSENPDKSSHETGMRKPVRSDFDQYLGDGNEQRATRHNEGRLPPFGRIDLVGARRYGDRAQSPSSHSIITIGCGVK